MKYFGKLPIASLMVSCTLLLGGCGFDGGPVISGDIGTKVEDSSDLSMKVKQALKKSPQTAVNNILVLKVSEDSVKLSGYVLDDATSHEAERVAGQVPGVRFVVNSLSVRR